MKYACDGNIELLKLLPREMGWINISTMKDNLDKHGDRLARYTATRGIAVLDQRFF